MIGKMGYLDKGEIAAVNALIHKIKQYHTIDQTILYGSKSRGDYIEYSDVDLLILTDEKLSTKELDNLIKMSSSINVDYGIAISCLIINKDDWLNEENINLSLKSNIDKDGVPIEV